MLPQTVHLLFLSVLEGGRVEVTPPRTPQTQRFVEGAICPHFEVLKCEEVSQNLLKPIWLNQVSHSHRNQEPETCKGCRPFVLPQTAVGKREAETSPGGLRKFKSSPLGLRMPKSNPRRPQEA